MSQFYNHPNAELIPSYNLPSKLSCIAAKAVIRLLVYEDYEDCNFYRWDPVIIWQYETHQPKKKKAGKVSSLDNSVYGHPPPPWKGIRKLRDWWCEESAGTFGHLDSPLRQLLVDALEKQSWTSFSEEENILFLLLRLCMDTHMHFVSTYINDNWCADLTQILENLGPYPLQKLVVENDVFQEKTSILSTVIQNSPNLQILRISQWELSNDILFSVGSHCPLLQEFSIHGMEPDVFMSDEALFKCFFGGMTPEEVLKCHREGVMPQISFSHLKYVDILFYKQMERLVLMLAYFYPSVSFSSLQIDSDSNKITEPFLEVNAKLPFLRVCGRTEDLLQDKVLSCFKHSSCLKELRLHIDDKFPGTDSDCMYNRQLEIASQKLKKLFDNESVIDSLALRPHQGTDITKVLLPTFGSYGSLLRCLYFIYDLSPVSTNTLYQLLNLTPLLEKLVIEISPEVEDASSRSFSTAIRENFSLETFIVYDIEDEHDEEENEHSGIPANSIIIRDVLRNCSNLKNLSLQLCDVNTRLFESLHSTSVERLQLNLSDGYYNHVLPLLLPSFPNLKLLSLLDKSKELWSETLVSLNKKGINITKKPQEFANVFRWHENNPSSKQSAIIMFM